MGDVADWLARAVAGSGVAGLAIWGLIEIIKTVANRRIRDVTAADKLSDSALELVRQAQANAEAAWKEARSARQDADDARREASEARREATEARRDAMTAVANMRRMTSAIMSPYATVEGLRAMVGDPPTSNGTATQVRA